jgi:hypothetical protein
MLYWLKAGSSARASSSKENLARKFKTLTRKHHHEPEHQEAISLTDYVQVMIPMSLSFKWIHKVRDTKLPIILAKLRRSGEASV